jgi:uncharacterized membrane protein
MSPIGWIHVAFALVALATGAVVLVRRKGTRPHRRWGWVYALCMFGLNLTAFSIYRLFGGFGPFHVAAVVSAVTLVGGITSALRRRPGWVARHYRWMTWSYVGLLAALVSEVGTRVPGTPFWGAVLLASAVVIGAGGYLIRVRADATLAPFVRRA